MTSKISDTIKVKKPAKKDLKNAIKEWIAKKKG